MGTGCAFLFLPSVAIVATYFTSRRAVATGITASGGSIGKYRISKEESHGLTLELRLRDLPYRVPQTDWPSWFRLDDSCHRIYCSRRTTILPSCDENASATSKADTKTDRHERIQRIALYCAQSGTILRFYWSIFPLLLPSHLLHNLPPFERKHCLLQCRNSQCRLGVWAHHARSARRSYRLPQHHCPN